MLKDSVDEGECMQGDMGRKCLPLMFGTCCGQDCPRSG
jgi:hypothetical protein